MNNHSHEDVLVEENTIPGISSPEFSLFFLNQHNFRLYSVPIAKKLDCIHSAIFLSELINRYEYHAKAGELEFFDGKYWFFYTIEKCTDRLAMGRKIQDKAIKNLEKHGLISRAVKGVPPKRFFTINETAILDFLNLKKKSTNLSFSDKSIIPNGTNRSVNTKKITKGRTTTTKGKLGKAKSGPKAGTQAPPVVVFFEKLDIKPALKKKLTKKYTSEELEVAAKRVVTWEGRQNDAAALQYVLENPQQWEDKLSKEQIKENNLIYLRSLRCHDGKWLNQWKIIVGPEYIEFDAYPRIEHFNISDQRFIMKVNKFFKDLDGDADSSG